LTACMLCVCAVALTACGSSNKKSERLEGERIPVLAFERQIQPDPRIGDLDVVLPAPFPNAEWPQAGGYPGHVMQHLDLGADPKRLWRTRIGAGSTGRKWLTTPPVVAAGKVYAIDSKAVVRAFATDDGRRAWERELRREGESKAVSFGGGVAFADGRIYATTGYGIVAALEAETGREIWRMSLNVPLRGAPTVVGNQLYVHTYDNQLYALGTQEGNILWDHVGIVEVATLMGQASPAFAAGTVVAAYSSGEVVALRAENGHSTWNDSLTRRAGLTPLASLNDVNGHPVISGGRVYAVSHGGRMVAIDLRTGERVWENNVGSLHTPWVAGDFIFVVSTDNEVVAIAKDNGRIRWVQQLQRFKNAEKRSGPIQWAGPVLAGDRLVVTSSHGFALSLSPYTGEIISGMRLSDGGFLPPVVANNVLYILTNDGELTALQ
ncbi:MAG: PQQ-binding-like beta-propeller repeat protein, partial [Sphingomonadales bacterium]